MRKLTSLDHSLVKHLTKLRMNRDYRYEHKSLVIPGIKPTAELMKHFHIKTILVYDETFLPKKYKADEVYEVNEAIMKKTSGLQNPEGILVEVEMPEPAHLEKLNHVLVLDGINDPGNMGTLIRTALALGWEGVFILENSCDPYNDKALRAARGATFHLPIYMGNWNELDSMVEEYGWSPIVADINGSTPESLPKHDRLLLVLSNEAHGVSPEAEALCTKVTVPMQSKVESLNVAIAGGILMYLLRNK